jgi:hypothetical protein
MISENNERLKYENNEGLKHVNPEASKINKKYDRLKENAGFIFVIPYTVSVLGLTVWGVLGTGRHINTLSKNDDVNRYEQTSQNLHELRNAHANEMRGLRLVTIDNLAFETERAYNAGTKPRIEALETAISIYDADSVSLAKEESVQDYNKAKKQQEVITYLGIALTALGMTFRKKIGKSMQNYFEKKKRQALSNPGKL